MGGRVVSKKTVERKLERSIKAEVLLELSKRGIMAWNNPTGTFLTMDGKRVVKFTPGIADVMGVCRDGRALAIETKTSEGRLRDSQKKFKAAFERAGGYYAVIRDVSDLDKHPPLDGK